jgi:hypothetical protein
MFRLSSNTTLFFKLFLPTFWTVFFGLFTLAVWITDDYIGPLGFIEFKLGMTVFFITGVVILFFSFFRLKRVEADGHFFYVTNYFKTYRYPPDVLEKYREDNFLILRVGRLYLKEKGSFGRRISFIISRKNMQEYRLEHPLVLPGEGSAET